jgi:hypothetical protein
MLWQLFWEYDYLGESGEQWAVLRFVRALAVKFTPDLAVDAQMIGAFSKVCQIDNSNWLKQTIQSEGRSRGVRFPFRIGWLTSLDWIL